MMKLTQKTARVYVYENECGFFVTTNKELYNQYLGFAEYGLGHGYVDVKMPEVICGDFSEVLNKIRFEISDEFGNLDKSKLTHVA